MYNVLYLVAVLVCILSSVRIPEQARKWEERAWQICFATSMDLLETNSLDATFPCHEVVLVLDQWLSLEELRI